MKRVLYLSLFFLCFVQISCEDADTIYLDETTQNEVAQTEDVTIVTAGARALELGVFQWEINSEKTARGFNEKHDVVAEFHLDAEAGLIHCTIPEIGVRGIGKSTVADTLSDKDAAYLSVLISDVETAIGSSILDDSNMDQPVNKAVYGCYRYWNDCDLQGFYLVYIGLIRGYVCYYPTSTCGTRWALLI